MGIGVAGDICMRCGGKIGTRQEWTQAAMERMGIPALEAKIKGLEARVAKLEKRAKK
jgi:NMD protein affecting ribosome stability and mRNA decay